MSRYIRELEAKDSPQVCLIEAECFTCPRSEAQLLTYFLNNPSARGLVVEENGKLLGFIIWYETAVAWKVELIAVLPDKRRQGIGRELVTDLIALFATERAPEQHFVDVLFSEYYLDLQLLLRSLHFQVWQIFKDRFAAEDDDDRDQSIEPTQVDGYNMVYFIRDPFAKIGIVPSVVRKPEFTKRYE